MFDKKGGNTNKMSRSRTALSKAVLGVQAAVAETAYRAFSETSVATKARLDAFQVTAPVNTFLETKKTTHREIKKRRRNEIATARNMIAANTSGVGRTEVLKRGLLRHASDRVARTRHLNLPLRRTSSRGSDDSAHHQSPAYGFLSFSSHNAAKRKMLISPAPMLHESYKDKPGDYLRLLAVEAGMLLPNGEVEPDHSQYKPVHHIDMKSTDFNVILGMMANHQETALTLPDEGKTKVNMAREVLLPDGRILRLREKNTNSQTVEYYSLYAGDKKKEVVKTGHTRVGKVFTGDSTYENDPVECVFLKHAELQIGKYEEGSFVAEHTSDVEFAFPPHFKDNEPVFHPDRMLPFVKLFEHWREQEKTHAPEKAALLANCKQGANRSQFVASCHLLYELQHEIYENLIGESTGKERRALEDAFKEHFKLPDNLGGKKLAVLVQAYISANTLSSQWAQLDNIAVFADVAAKTLIEKKRQERRGRKTKDSKEPKLASEKHTLNKTIKAFREITRYIESTDFSKALNAQGGGQKKEEWISELNQLKKTYLKARLDAMQRFHPNDQEGKKTAQKYKKNLEKANIALGEFTYRFLTVLEKETNKMQADATHIIIKSNLPPEAWQHCQDLVRRDSSSQRRLTQSAPPILGGEGGTEEPSLAQAVGVMPGTRSLSAHLTNTKRNASTSISSHGSETTNKSKRQYEATEQLFKRAARERAEARLKEPRTRVSTNMKSFAEKLSRRPPLMSTRTVERLDRLRILKREIKKQERREHRDRHNSRQYDGHEHNSR